MNKLSLANLLPKKALQAGCRRNGVNHRVSQELITEEEKSLFVFLAHQNTSVACATTSDAIMSS